MKLLFLFVMCFRAAMINISSQKYHRNVYVPKTCPTWQIAECLGAVKLWPAPWGLLVLIMVGPSPSGEATGNTKGGNLWPGTAVSKHFRPWASLMKHKMHMPQSMIFCDICNRIYNIIINQFCCISIYAHNTETKKTLKKMVRKIH